MTKNDAPVSIDVTLANPGDLEDQVGYTLYRPDGAILEGWIAFNNGTTTNNTPLNGLSRVNTFLMFFKQKDKRLGYIMLPPITMILK